MVGLPKFGDFDGELPTPNQRPRPAAGISVGTDRRAGHAASLIAWLRPSAADELDYLDDDAADVDHTVVRDARAYLVRIVTRQASNRLRTLQR